jgi:hypothetical protein
MRDWQPTIARLLWPLIAPALEGLLADHCAPVAFHRGVVRGDELRRDHALDFILRSLLVKRLLDRYSLSFRPVHENKLTCKCQFEEVVGKSGEFSLDLRNMLGPETTPTHFLKLKVIIYQQPRLADHRRAGQYRHVPAAAHGEPLGSQLQPCRLVR